MTIWDDAPVVMAIGMLVLSLIITAAVLACSAIFGFDIVAAFDDRSHSFGSCAHSSPH